MTTTKPLTLDSEYDYPLHLTGSAHAVSSEGADENDVVGLLHAVIAEVTGKAVPQPQKQRMGFLP